MNPSEINRRFSLRTAQAVDDPKAQLDAAKLSTRLAFFIAGFALACWAPLVPYAQQRLHADAATLGTVLLCLGLGAVIGMPLSSAISARKGPRPVIVAGALGLACTLPLLASVSDALALGVSLLVFGASIGAIDVAANIHGVEVEAEAQTPLMSGFHGLYSIGGLVGACAMTGLIAVGLGVLAGAALAAALIVGCIVVAGPGFYTTRPSETPPLFVIPKGVVTIIGVLAAIVFLAEGAVLDWSAILLTQVKEVDVSLAGAGYAVFALAMTVARMFGDKFVTKFGESRTLYAGFAMTGIGLAIAALTPSFPVLLCLLAFAGLGAGNVVPVLFSLAGRQKIMPAGQAIAAASILGYLGILMGPALIGYFAQSFGLVASFCVLGCILLLSLTAVRSVERVAPSRS